jgi:hypothetical protein
MSNLWLAVLALGACTSDSVSSDEQARRAYLGLDSSISQSMQLGFDGFNSANSANISPQTGSGSGAGTITITGQVDQGSSANKGMRLLVGMAGYSPGKIDVGNGETVTVTYATDPSPATQPALTLSLKGIPNGTLTGTLVGTYHLTGDLTGDVLLSLTFAGSLRAGMGSATVARVPGTTTVTGTAVSGGGTYNVMLSI